MLNKSKNLVLGIPISPSISLPELEIEIERRILQKTSLTGTFVNPHAVYLARNNSNYVSCLEDFDIVLCDGQGMAYAGQIVLNDKIQRISFDATSLAPIVFNLASKHQTPVVLIGGRPGVSIKAKATLEKKYPSLRIDQTYSGFGEDLDIALERARDFSIFIVGLGAPAQELYSLKLQKHRPANIIFTCGGYFDQIGENDQYYPHLINKLNIRSLYRIYKEPKRLLRRYLIEYLPFLQMLIRHKIGI